MYYLRTLIVWTLRAAAALYQGALGLVLWSVLVIVVVGLCKHVRLRWARLAVLTLADAALFALALFAQPAGRRLLDRIRPPLEMMPAWLRDGLFGGKYAACIPWSQGEKRVSRFMNWSFAVLAILQLLALSAARWWRHKHADVLPPGARRAIVLLCGAQLCAGAACALMNLWHLLHRRLRPSEDRAGFEPLMPETPRFVACAALSINETGYATL